MKGQNPNPFAVGKIPQEKPAKTSKKTTGVLPEKVRYSDDELLFFSGLIIEKMNRAKVEYKEFSGVDYDDDPKDPGDKGNLAMSLESNKSQARRQWKFIKSLEKAMVRIENKSYGICRETGKLIPKERLMIVPHATLCVEAKNNPIH